jgi:hypothetical protein
MKSSIKKLFTAMLICFIINSALSQPTNQRRIEDSVIGWKQTYSFKGKQYKPLTVERQIYSSYQQSLRDSFITWMQRTYLPIGGWGDIFHKDYTTRQNKGPVPQGIGMYALIYTLFKSERTGKYDLVPNESHADIGIFSNTLFGTNPIYLFNSSDGHFFTMPKNNYESTFTNADVVNWTKEYGLHDDNRFSKYMVYFDGLNVNVVLTPGNRLPIVQLTKGEVLQECEKGIAREVEERKKEARRMSSNNPSYHAGVIKDLDEKLYPQCIKNLNVLKEKYKDKLNEPAVLNGQQGPSFADFVNSNTTLFIEDWYQKKDGFPVYRYTKEAIEQSKKDKPLWITVSWQPQKPNSLAKGYEIHRAMLRYFNYDYVYNYFFNPEKVKGQTYSVTNAEEQLTLVKNLRKHYTSPVKELPQGVFFMDDFSANAEGSRPGGWNDSKNRVAAKIVSLKNQPGKWVQLGHFNDLSPSTALKKTLPENFTLEFDVVTDEFSVRTGGSVKLSLSSYPTNAEGFVTPNSKGTTLEWQITAGNEADFNNNNYHGESKPSINSTIAGYEGSYNYTYSSGEFTNKKTSLHATIKVNNGQAIFFINGKEIVASKDFKQDYCRDCVCKGIPPGTTFRKITFANTTQNWSPDGKSDQVNVYISNIKITKD